ncbi:uncharacterized protein LOC106081438 isoform X2 [Stomoxys calcitrans]|uniref:Fork-head domain-containing protein n=1 Tax=Stomoxys calcitrans TaxID=35570 RepID=A0A1I8P571_STOCA|nr:uncharacterized protein LOC106081438 isoform X2 [Stomoxys calcitrans]
MILNMPVTNGAITSAPSAQSQNDYCDFLKRKYPENDISSPSNPGATESSPTPSYPENCSTNTNDWKKARHMNERSCYEMAPVTSSTNSYNNNDHISAELSTSNVSTSITQTCDVTTTAGATSGTFNIMSNSSSFINDLFAYDSSLLVSTTSAGAENSLCNEEPTYATPSTICVNTTQQYEEDNNDNWQATDLLELDHRYNSSLQTEITHLNPTVSLKPHEETLVTLAEQKHNLHSTPTLPMPSRSQLSSESSYLSPTSKSPSVKECPEMAVHQVIDNEIDFEDRNLSWLLNFKFDEFPHLSPDLAGSNTKNSKFQHISGQHKNSSGSSQIASGQCNRNGSARERSKSPKVVNKMGKKFEELVMEVTSEMDGADMVVAENVVIEDTSSPPRVPKKPPFTYTELIEYALEDKGELTVSGIYTWISDRFPYYKSNDDRWKNSVRHNLSINPHFRKGHKAPQGAGHLWTISSGDSAENVLAWEHKKQRLDLFFKMESMNRERMAQHHQLMQQQSNANAKQKHLPHHHNKHLTCQQDSCQYDEAAIAAAAIQQEMMQQQGHSNNDINDIATHNRHRNTSHIGNESAQHHQQQSLKHELPYNELLTEEELRKTAGQILNGIHREVEVQSVSHQSIIGTYHDVLLDNDYLNPVHKDVAVNESGLRHITPSIDSSTANNTQCHSTTTSYYVTEIDPMELGIQMSSHPHPLTHSHPTPGNQHHHQHHHQQSQLSHDVHPNVNGEETDGVLFHDEFNLNYFTYNSAADIVA